MIPRRKIFDQYWRLAAERQAIFFRRLEGSPPPWTDDPILQQYKFCNAYRASDRYSQYLIKHVIYGGSQSEEEVVFRALLFRLFNHTETFQLLEDTFGSVAIGSFEVGAYARVLEAQREKGETIFGSAFILCASRAFGHQSKHVNYLALIRHMLDDGLAAKVTAARGLGEVFALLRSYPLIGDFMAYQIATDLNYSEVIDFPENSFTCAGPGAKRGIAKCFRDTEGKKSDYVINWMVDAQEREFERLGIDFKDLWGRPLQAIDCQNLFCETDKYCRVAFPELKSNRTRIKKHFTPTRGPAIEYFYPPKWGLNDRIKRSVQAPSEPPSRAGERPAIGP